MVKKILISLGAIVGVLVVAVLTVLTLANWKYSQSAEKNLSDPKLTLETIAQESWTQEGARIAKMKGCYDCHGANLGGKVFIDDPAVGTYVAANLTKGKGGVGNYSDQDWVRAIRYGINRDQKYLQFMPSEEFSHLSDEDLGKLIVYLKSLPAVDNEQARSTVGPMAKVLYLMGKMPLLFSGESIATAKQPPVKVEINESPEYGRYLAAGCTGCHGGNLQGGPIPGVPPNWPHAANITKRGALGTMSFEQFKTTLKTGVTLQGRTLNPQYMPWTSTAAMSDVELKALYNFLSQL